MVDAEEKRERKREYCRQWHKAHRDRTKEYKHQRFQMLYYGDPEFRRQHNEASKVWQRTEKGKETARLRAQSERGKRLSTERKQKYRASSKGQETERKYEKSESRKAVVRNYRTSEKGRAVNARNNAKRYRNLKTLTTLTAEEWNTILADHRFRCYWCQKKSPRLTQDHVIPISRGGHHVKENVVPACKSCNSKKHNYLWSLV